MTRFAERDEILFGVVAVAAEFLMMKLKVLQAATVLAPPVVALEDLEAQPVVGIGVGSAHLAQKLSPLKRFVQTSRSESTWCNAGTSVAACEEKLIARPYPRVEQAKTVLIYG